MLYYYLVYWVFGKCQDKQINAGTYIGYVKDLLIMLKHMLLISEKISEKDDQIVLTNFCKKSPNNVYIDCDNLFFLTIVNPIVSIIDKYMEINNNELVYKGVRPFFIHGNGNTNLNELIIKLGYDISNDEKKRIYKYHKKFIFKKTIYFIKYFVILLILLCIILIILIKYKKIKKNLVNLLKHYDLVIGKK